MLVFFQCVSVWSSKLKLSAHLPRTFSFEIFLFVFFVLEALGSNFRSPLILLKDYLVYCSTDSKYTEMSLVSPPVLCDISV